MLRNPHASRFFRVFPGKPHYFPGNSPKPLFFSSQKNDNDKKDKKNGEKSENSQGFSLNSAINRLNSYLTSQEAALLKYFSGFNRKTFESLPKSRILLFFMGFLFFGYQVKTLVTNFEAISQQDLLHNYLANRLISRIRINKILDSAGYYYKADVFLSSGERKVLEIGNLDFFLEKLENLQKENDTSYNELIPIEFKNSRTWVAWYEHYYYFAYGIVTMVLLIGLAKRWSRDGTQQNNVFGIRNSKARIITPEINIKIRFADVAGLDEAKVEITEFVDFLKNPNKYKRLGAKLPRGALLAGPPGTGKTMLAKACAGEAKVPFFYMSGSDFVEMFVGVGAARVRDLFKQAKEHSPAIVFIDEIDAVGHKLGGNDERDNTLNQLLVEMDGFGTDVSVVVLAATNQKDLLDPALTRPGRFDRNIDVSLPDLAGRRQIFHVHLKPLKLDPATSLDEFARRLASLTPGFSGADIANLCNEAAILAARNERSHVKSMDFEMASERVLAGLEKKNLLSEEEKKRVAVHESGHAVVSWMLKGGAPLLKVTIIPRSKGSLGYAQYLPSENSLENAEDLMDRVCSLLGGRCAEEVFFGKISTGAYDDLQKVTEMVYVMVSKLGMNENIGLRGFKIEEYVKSLSQETLKEIDDEVQKIVREATEKTKNLIIQHRDLIEKLSNALLEKESLDLKSIITILGDRPFPVKDNFKEYLETKKLIEKEQENSEASQQKHEEKSEI